MASSFGSTLRRNLSAMRFRRGATLDPGQVVDRRGMGGGGLAVGGGGLGLVGLLAFLLINYLSGGGLGATGSLDGRATQGVPLSKCRTGEQANQREDCAILADVNSVQKFWSGQTSSNSYFARRSRPVISLGCATCIIPNIVGEISCSAPPERSERVSSSTTINGTGFVV